MLDWLLWWQQRGGPASDWLSSVLYEYVGEEDLEVKHQVVTKLRLYQTYIVPVLMYGCETWANTKYLLCRLDAFDTWALRARSWGYRILAMCQMRKSEEPLVVHPSFTWWLIDVCGSSAILLAVHLARTIIEAACIRQVPPDWKRPAGRPSHTWLRAIEADLGPLNFGLATAWRKATIRDEWRHIVDTATLQRSTLWKKNAPWNAEIGDRVEIEYGSRIPIWPFVFLNRK